MRVDAERYGFGKNRVRATATVIAREPAVKIYMRDAALLEGGRLLTLSKYATGARADGSSLVKCIVGPGAVPALVYHKAHRMMMETSAGHLSGCPLGFGVIDEPVAPHTDHLDNLWRRLLGDLDLLGPNRPGAKVTLIDRVVGH